MDSSCHRLLRFTLMMATALGGAPAVSAAPYKKVVRREVVYWSPDRKMRAVVVYYAPFLYGVGESRIDLHQPDGRRVASQGYADGGTQGYRVVKAAWTPDACFFVFSMTSAGGHSPWHAPTHLYDVRRRRFYDVDPLVRGEAVTNPRFKIAAPNTLTVVGRENTKLKLNLREMGAKKRGLALASERRGVHHRIPAQPARVKSNDSILKNVTVEFAVPDIPPLPSLPPGVHGLPVSPPPKIFLPGTDVELDREVVGKVEELVIWERLPEDKLEIRLVALQELPRSAAHDREFERVRAELDRHLDEQIRTRPGLKPYLFYLLDNRLTNPYHIAKILNALACRDDLEPKDIEVVSQQMVGYLDHPITDFDSRGARELQDLYLEYGAKVLGRNITPENEAILLRGVNADWKYSSSAVNVAMAEVLAQAEIAGAVPVMETAITRLEAKKGPPWSVAELKEALARLKEALARREASRGAPPAGPISVRPSSYPHHFSPE